MGCQVIADWRLEAIRVPHRYGWPKSDPGTIVFDQAVVNCANRIDGTLRVECSVVRFKDRGPLASKVFLFKNEIDLLLGEASIVGHEVDRSEQARDGDRGDQGQRMERLG